MADTGAVTMLGGGQGPALGRADGQLVFIPGTFLAGATYATGGNPVTLPAGDQGMKLKQLIITTPHDGTRLWVWDGSTSAPKVKAYDAFATEEGNGTNTSAVTLSAIFVYEA